MTTATAPAPTGSGPKPVIDGRRPHGQVALVYVAVIMPMLAVLVAVPLAWGWGLTWTDIGLAAGFYLVSALGVTVGFHRLFTHRSFNANRPLRIALAIAGSTALQGDVLSWVADHRRHHAFSDKEGDPHSPWRFGTSPTALAKGLWWSHVGWLFEPARTNADRFAPDLVADRDISAISRRFGLLTLASLLAPALLGGLISMSWWGAATAFVWAGLVRVAVLHHVTWSINSICHVLGDRPFASRDRSANVWPLAILSMGESWHNLHHADPTCARHGVRRGQIDISARVIWVFEKLRWADSVRWPTPVRLERLARSTA
ncbi:MAG: stearoyl-CoA 9-desaturase [Pseudonocardia sp. SCN 73-27]|mgnify:FL=1|uniref:acyl-CoA desaturase n=1 Tax=unclassified Pseudonocardia TaxID=2619320 RepID=UPI0008698463|nr:MULTISPECIES: acyl-CoA desaturase [unclassified Pseudonocardia]ODU24884.1 MAG: stearoyl-CoA 9-desaturase [Pseudonocardia sp. SCN 72-51]ODV04724.1 MAG: stearoyl-CoA 9-desaturase [Pseudonocardia sp. SCN 73-27]